MAGKKGKGDKNQAIQFGWGCNDSPFFLIIIRRITSAVSGKTTYLLRGRDAGESKIAKAKSLGTKVLDEDGFYSLVENSAEQKQPDMAPMEKPFKPAVAKGKAPVTTAAPSPSSASAGGKTA